MESPSGRDDTQWLTYWTVFGFLNLLEFFSDFLLYWIPFYYLFKAGLILYLVLPQTKGAEVVYTRFLRPYLVTQEKNIDATIKKVKEKADQVVDDLLEKKDS